MQRYILLMTLTKEGREQMLRDPDSVLRAEDEIEVRDTGLLGLYGVLGDCDFVGILDAPDNECAARFSLELGAKVGMHITTMPAIPISRLEGASREDAPKDTPSEIFLDPPGETIQEYMQMASREDRPE